MVAPEQFGLTAAVGYVTKTRIFIGESGVPGVIRTRDPLPRSLFRFCRNQRATLVLQHFIVWHRLFRPVRRGA